MESWAHLLRLFAHLNPQSSDFGYICALSSPFLVVACVPVFVCVARKLWPCLSYSRRRDRIDLGLFCSLDKRGGGYISENPIRPFLVHKLLCPRPPLPPPLLLLHWPSTSQSVSWSAGHGRGLVGGGIRARCPVFPGDYWPMKKVQAAVVGPHQSVGPEGPERDITMQCSGRTKQRRPHFLKKDKTKAAP